MRQQGFETLARLLDPTDASQRIDTPERAHVERRLRQAEVVRCLVAAHEGSVAQRALQHVDRADEARVRGRQKTHFGHQQHAGIEVARAERGKRLALFVPGRIEDALPDAVGALAPVHGPLGYRQHQCRLGQPVARGP